MRTYRRDNEDKINSLNRCHFDAEHGWVQLALDRLADVRQEFPNDGHVEYCEALIRKDFLGQGAVAEEFFLKALRADPSFKFAAFNAGKYARSFDEFQRQARAARVVCAGDPDLQFFRQVEEEAQHLRYEVVLAQGCQEYHAHGKFGESAALAELSLGAGPHSLENELGLRTGRAQALRELDKAAANSRTTRGEGFPPEERLALKDAITELGKAIELDPEDHILWNFQSAWLNLLCRWDDAIVAADKALSLCPQGYLKPLTNKALALAGKGQKEDARSLAEKAHALASKLGAEGSADRELARHQLEDLGRETGSDDEVLAALAERITNGAGLIAKQEMAQWQDSNEGAELLKGLEQRCAAAGKAWSDLYIRIVSKMLIYFCPATAWISILKLSDSDSEAYKHCLYAAIYIAAHDPGITGRDACRFLVYLLLGAREPAKIRRSYREAILGPAAVGSGAFAGLADRMRSELTSVNPSLAKLVANQPALTDQELEHARSITLARFQNLDFSASESSDRRLWSSSLNQDDTEHAKPITLQRFPPDARTREVSSIGRIGSTTINIVIVSMLVVGFVIPLAASPPVCFLAFLAASIVPFFAGKSRRVIDPIAGFQHKTLLSPKDLHSWAAVVCFAGGYQKAYDRYVNEAGRGFDEKLPLVLSQIKAINYIHAWKVLFLLLGGLLAFSIYDTFSSGRAVIWHAPVVTGCAMGVIWGYSLGVYRLWRTCRRFKSRGGVPL